MTLLKLHHKCSSQHKHASMCVRSTELHTNTEYTFALFVVFGLKCLLLKEKNEILIHKSCCNSLFCCFFLLLLLLLKSLTPNQRAKARPVPRPCFKVPTDIFLPQRCNYFKIPFIKRGVMSTKDQRASYSLAIA